MKITFQGFALYPGQGISLPEFADVLVKASSAETEHLFNHHHRLLLFEKDAAPDFYTGLLITAKDQRTFPELRNEKGKISIKVSELAEGSRLMDFNFFVLHKKTFCGVYQHYHASCSPVQFGYFLRKFYWAPEREVRAASFAKALITEKGLAEEVATARAKKAFLKMLRFDLFYKKDDFVKILTAMNEIKRFQFDISTSEVKQGLFTPDIELKRRQENVAFANSTLVEKIATGIGKFVKAKKIEKGRIIAIDPEGVERSIHLTRNIDGFGEFDFDEVTAELQIDDLATDFPSSPVIASLLATARDNSHLFCAPND